MIIQRAAVLFLLRNSFSVRGEEFMDLKNKVDDNIPSAVGDGASSQKSASADVKWNGAIRNIDTILFSDIKSNLNGKMASNLGNQFVDLVTLSDSSSRRKLKPKRFTSKSSRNGGNGNNRNRNSSSPKTNNKKSKDEDGSSKKSNKKSKGDKTTSSSSSSSSSSDFRCVADPDLILNGQVLTCTTDLSQAELDGASATFGGGSKSSKKGSKKSSKKGSKKRRLQDGIFLSGKVGCADLTSSIVEPCDGLKVHVTYVLDLSCSTGCPCGNGGSTRDCEVDGIIAANQRLAMEKFMTSAGIIQFGFQIPDDFISTTELLDTPPQDPEVESTLVGLNFNPNVCSPGGDGCAGGPSTEVNGGYARAAESVRVAFANDPDIVDSFVIWVTDGNLDEGDASDQAELADAIAEFNSFGTTVWTFAIGANSECSGPVITLASQTGGVCTRVPNAASLAASIIDVILDQDEQRLERVTITITEPDGNKIEVDGCPIASCRAHRCPTEVHCCEPIELNGRLADDGPFTCSVASFSMDENGNEKVSSCPVEFEI